MITRKVPGQKLAPPPSWPRALRRSRLESALDAAIAAQQHVTLVAGAGYGKSTLVAAWSASRTCVWTTLDADDAELDAFLTVLVVAFERALPGFCTEARDLLLRARDRDAAHAVLAALLADLDEQCVDPVVLVIDDYHLAASPSTDALIARLLKYLPPAVRLVILARKAPEISLASLQAAHRLCVIGEAELAFDLVELGALHPDQPEGQLPALARATGGWPAALGMTSELLDAYVDEELLARTPAAIAAAMQRLAVVEAFDADLCEDVLGAPLTAADLTFLLAERLVTRHGQDRFMLHPVVRNLLLRRYMASAPRAERQALFERVGESYWRNDQPLIGLRYWIGHGHLALAVGRLRDVAEAWLAEGRLEALASALEAIGSAARDLPLLVIQGDLYRRWGDFAAADALYEQAVAVATGEAAATWRTRARLGQAQAAAARGNIALARQRRAEAALAGKQDGRLELDAMNLDGGLALLGGATEEAIACFEAAARMAERLGDAFVLARATHNLGICFIRLGEFERALASYDAAMGLASGDATPAIWMSPINRALVLIHLDRPAEAERAADAALALVRRFKLAREEGYALRVLGFAKVRLGSFEPAAACFDAAERLARAAGDELGLAYTLNFRAELSFAEGDLEGALARIAEVALAMGDASVAAGILEFAQVRAKVMLAAGLPEARSFASALIVRALDTGYKHIGESTARLLERAPEAPGAPCLELTSSLDRRPEIEVRCFGGFRAYRQGTQIPDRDWQTVRAKLLLAYFLHFPEGATKAQLLGEVFFGEEVSNDLMNITILRLRKALEPDLERGQPSRFVLRADGRYAFNAQAHVQVDTQDFEAALRGARLAQGSQRRRQLERAIELYGGEFLPEHNGPWVLLLRQRLQDQALEACRQLIAIYDAEAPRLTLGLLQRALEIDPLSETFNRELILRYIEAKEPQRALQQFEICERRYKELLDISPPADLARLVLR
ncbi:MAG: transcriptional activator domain protein [Cyanobacteria bacterium RYN_339]|nr:transcriptional activator domain protein [Cyanobacteria bacterium RYN_339]